MADLSLNYILTGEDKSASSSIEAVGKTSESVGQRAGAALGSLGTAIGGELGDIIGKAGEGLDAFAGKAGGIAPKMTAAGVGIGALGVALSTLGSGDAASKAQLDAAITATGKSAADYTEQIEKTVKSQENFGHSATDTQDALATLTSATGDPTKAMSEMGVVADLAASKHISLSDASTQVAKILAGSGARTLTEYGVKMGNTGDKTADAQTALDQLSGKLSGQAAASVDSYTGKLDVWKTKALDQVAVVGQKLGPALQVAGVVTGVLGSAMQLLASRQALASGASEAQAAVTVEQTGATEAATIATDEQTTSTGLLNTVMSLNPIMLVVLAIIALVAVFVVAYEKSETFRDIVNGAFNDVLGVVQGTWHWVADNWPLLLAILTGPIGLAVLAITKNWGSIKTGFSDVANWIGQKVDDVVGFFTGMPDKIGSGVNKAWTALETGAKMAFNGVADGWNDTVGKLSFSIPHWVPRIGGDSWSVPHIPHVALAQGGVVTSPTMAMIGEGGEPEAVVPLSKAGKMGFGQGGGDVYNINLSGIVGDTNTVAKVVVQAIADARQRGTLPQQLAQRAFA